MISSFLKTKKNIQLRLVIGLNQVDKLVENGWNERLNAPTKEAERAIQRRSEDIINKLAKYSQISSSYLEYYSALKCYRLLPLLSKIIRNAHAGFKLDNVRPTDPFDLADFEVKEFVQQEREKRIRNQEQKNDSRNELFDEMKKILSFEELELIRNKLTEEYAHPPRVAVLGKTGVGKTTTINNVFNAKLKTSHTVVGTTEAQVKNFELSTGGTLSVIDLPGYGRSISEDKEYEKIYQDIIPSCDLLFLVIQANSKDLADDQEMILKVKQWLEDSPNTTTLRRLQSMGKMTDEEKQRVLEMLDQLDSGERERKISSLEAFSNWLRSAATEIYNKVKDQLQRFWSTICSIFS